MAFFRLNASQNWFHVKSEEFQWHKNPYFSHCKCGTNFDLISELQFLNTKLVHTLHSVEITRFHSHTVLKNFREIKLFLGESELFVFPHCVLSKYHITCMVLFFSREYSKGKVWVQDRSKAKIRSKNFLLKNSVIKTCNNSSSEMTPPLK